MDVDKLRSVPLFASLRRDQLNQLARVTDEVDVPAGKELLREGRFPYEFMIIEEGRADVRRASGEHVAELGPGDFFGEVAALDWGGGFGYPRIASVRALTDVALIAFPAGALNEVARDHPHVAREIRRVSAQRLHDGPGRR